MRQNDGGLGTRQKPAALGYITGILAVPGVT